MEQSEVPQDEGTADDMKYNFFNVFPPTLTSSRLHEDLKCSLPSFKGVPMSPLQKEAVCRYAVENLKFNREFLYKYLDISPNRVDKMLAAKRAGKPFQDTSVGMCSVDDTGFEELIKKIKQFKNSPANPLTKTILSEYVNKCAKETHIRRGHNGLKDTSSDTFLHPDTVDAILERIPNFMLEKGQRTTEPRRREALDVRNFVTTAVQNECYAKDKAPHMLGNMDFTTFGVQYINNELLATIKEDGDDPVTFCESSTLGLYIKWMYLLTAAGTVGPDVFLLAADSMEVGDFYCGKIAGLSHHHSPDAVGYMCFCKTRAGNAAFYQWFMTEIVTEFVAANRKLLVEEDKDQSFFLVMDGEDIQTSSLENDTVLKAMEDYNIDVGKGACSSSGTAVKYMYTLI